MGAKSKIQWCDATWNPVLGCSPVSAGCANCYAARWAWRLYQMGLQRYDILANPDGTWTGSVHFVEGELNRPLTWRKPKRIFVCSMSDLFHSRVQPFLWDEVFSRMVLTPRHTYFILTKRPERMRDVLAAPGMAERVLRKATSFPLPFHPTGKPAWPQWPPKNVFVGTSIEDQPTADARLPFVMELAALGWRTMVSAEPLLGPVMMRWRDKPAGERYVWGYDYLTGVEFGPHHCNRGKPRLDWVICGGESGPNARPMHPDWARSLRDQCAAADVPFFFKQWGEWMPCSAMDDEEEAPGGAPWGYIGDDGIFDPGEDGVFSCRNGIKDEQTFRVGKHRAGRLLDGVEHNAFPEVPA